MEHVITQFGLWTQGLGQDCLQIFQQGEMQIRVACRFFHKEKHFATSIPFSWSIWTMTWNPESCYLPTNAATYIALSSLSLLFLRTCCQRSAEALWPQEEWRNCRLSPCPEIRSRKNTCFLLNWEFWQVAVKKLPPQKCFCNNDWHFWRLTFYNSSIIS